MGSSSSTPSASDFSPPRILNLPIAKPQPLTTTAPASSTRYSPTSTPSTSNRLNTTPAPNPPLDQATRARRQKGLFFGGAAFVVFSALITRRALTRRYKPVDLPTIPTAGARGAGPIAKGSSPTAGYKSASSTTTGTGAVAEAGGASVAETGEPSLQNSGSVLAVEALTIATLNVVSVAITATGGMLWYFDIASMDELRRKVRGGLGIDGSGRTEEEVEEEMEEWLATVLARKEDKAAAREGVVYKNERGRER